MNEDIDIILSRYFSGEVTKKELHTLDDWLSKSDENEKIFHQMTLLYQYTGQTDTPPAIDAEKALAQFKNHIHKTQKKRFSVFFRTSNIWKVAAAIALLAIATASLYYFTQPAENIHLVAVETQKEYTLFENADVTLFPGAEIVYTEKTNHHIQLKGKAAFNIQSKESKKMVVQAGDTYIEDIGTVFCVDATTPEESITVEVTEGEIWFYTDHNSGVYLHANESALYDSQIKQFRIVKKFVEELPELIFHNTPFNEAIEIIKTRYNVDIVVSSTALNEILLNTSFDNNESVEYVLEIITATFSAHWSKNNNTYTITL